MAYIIIFIHLFLLIRIYNKETYFGLKSVYCFGIFLFLFTPLLYNYFVFEEQFLPSIPVQLTFLFSSFLISRIKMNYGQLISILNTPIPINILKFLLKFYLILVLSLVVASAVGLGHLARFPAIGIFCTLNFFTLLTWLHREKYQKLWVRFAVLSASVLLVFTLLLWSGYGRLLLLQFVSIALFHFSFIQYKTKLIKWLFILAIPIGIGVGGILRLETTTFTQSLQTGSGALSVFSPLQDTEKVYSDISADKLQPVNGDSYVAALLFFIPREFWNDKPFGFGKQLVEWYYPTYMDTGFSLAGTWIAEAYGNFGWAGFLFAPLLIALIFQILAKFILGKRKIIKLSTHFTVIAAINVLCVIPDFIWGGLQPFLIRGMSSVIIIWVVYKCIDLFR